MDWVNKIQKVNNKFKFQLFGRNRENLEQCYSNISHYDTDHSGLMGEHQLNLFLNSFGVFLTTQEIRHIKEGFTDGSTGKINYLDFLQNIRNDVSEKRLATIDHCFQELSHNGVINLDELMLKFDENKHPHARCMLREPVRIRAEYEQVIRRRSADGEHLTESEWKQYYLDANACVPFEREEFFVDLMIHSFKLLDDRVTIDRLRQMEVTIYEKVREKTYLKKDEGEKGKTSFRFFDMEDKGIVDYKRFWQSMERLGCRFKEKEMKVLYQKHAGADGILTYEEMCGLLFEMGSGLKDNQNPIYETVKGCGQVNTQGMTKKIS